METYINLIAALIGLFSSWLAYKTASQIARAKACREAPRVLSAHDPSVSMTYWKPKRFIWVSVIFGLVYLIIIFSFRPHVLIFAIIGTILGIGINLVLLRIGRNEPPSRVCRSISVTLAKDFDNVMTACREALTSVRAESSRVDREKGIIQAKIPLSLWSWGALVDISLKTEGPARTSVQVSVDSVLPSTLFDFGYNTRVVRKIKNHILGM